MLVTNPEPLLVRGDLGRLDKGPYIMTDGGLSVSAGSDQADLCWSAIEFMLSEEIMDLFQDNIPLRASSFDTKILHDIADMTGPKEAIAEHNVMVSGGEEQQKYDVKMDAALIRDYRQLIASADTLSYLNEDLVFLIDEDLAPCLAGDTTPEDAAARLIERVGL